jgi:nicotinamide-nucleotide amidase
MIAEIVSVGTELLMGQVVNTDAQFIAQRLAPLGFQVFYHTTVGDNVKRLTAVVHQAVERSDVVVFTGGLGPTDDDLTKETVAAAFGMTVEPVPEEVEKLTKYFAARGYPMTPNNYKQASFPRAPYRSERFWNRTRLHPLAGGKTAILLPGRRASSSPCFKPRDALSGAHGRSQTILARAAYLRHGRVHRDLPAQGHHRKPDQPDRSALRQNRRSHLRVTALCKTTRKAKRSCAR